MQNCAIFAAVKELAQIISPIATELAQFEAFFGKTLHADTEPMERIMRYVGDTRGKRLRPMLVLLCAKLFGEVNERTVRAAAFVELVHSATLLHDDVVDDANERRGRSSVKAQFGNLSAVLAGDFLLAKAMLLLSEPGDHAILKEMLRTTATMSEGELMQGASVGRHPTDAYIDIITRKTAMLMRSCCVAGSLSVDATPEQVKQIANFGLHFGILFQLRDDLLDGENLEQAQAMLPVYHDKTMNALEGFPPSEITKTLRDLTDFCAEREG